MSRGEASHVLAWLALPLMAVANGALRDFTWGTALSRDLAHSISVVPLIVLILLWARFLARRRPLPTSAAALRVGAIWLGLTLLFEFGLGSLQGLTMAQMLAEYDLTRGRLWPLVPAATAVAPTLARRWRGRRRAPAGAPPAEPGGLRARRPHR